MSIEGNEEFCERSAATSLIRAKGKHLLFGIILLELSLILLTESIKFNA